MADETLAALVGRVLRDAPFAMRQLAADSGLSYDVLRSWRSGRRRPSRASVQRLAQGLEQRGHQLLQLSKELRESAGVQGEQRGGDRGGIGEDAGQGGADRSVGGTGSATQVSTPQAGGGRESGSGMGSRPGEGRSGEGRSGEGGAGDARAAAGRPDEGRERGIDPTSRDAGRERGMQQSSRDAGRDRTMESASQNTGDARERAHDADDTMAADAADEDLKPRRSRGDWRTERM